MIDSMRTFGNKVLVTKKNPTAEHIAELILAEAQRLFENSAIQVKCIEINETCTSDTCDLYEDSQSQEG